MGGVYRYSILIGWQWRRREKQHIDAENLLNNPQFELEDQVDTVEDDESSVD